MKKKIIITTTIVLVVLAICVAGYYFLRGTLEVAAKPTPFSVTIGKKTYQSDNVFDINLFIGPHKIVAKKDYYNDQTINTWINLNQTTLEQPNLTLSDDGKVLLANSYLITSAWIKYSQDSNSQAFLDTMSPKLTSDAHDSLAQTVSQANTTNGAGIITLAQTVTGPIKSVKLTKVDDTHGKALVTVTKQPNDLSVSSLEIDYVKSNDTWLAENIIYNY